MLDKLLGLNAKLRLSDRPDHIDNRFVSVNGGGGDDEFNYYSLCWVVTVHGIIPKIMHRA